MENSESWWLRRECLRKLGSRKSRLSILLGTRGRSHVKKNLKTEDVSLMRENSKEWIFCI